MWVQQQKYWLGAVADLWDFLGGWLSRQRRRKIEPPQVAGGGGVWAGGCASSLNWGGVYAPSQKIFDFWLQNRLILCYFNAIIDHIKDDVQVLKTTSKYELNSKIINEIRNPLYKFECKKLTLPFLAKRSLSVGQIIYKYRNRFMHHLWTRHCLNRNVSRASLLLCRRDLRSGRCLNFSNK